MQERADKKECGAYQRELRKERVSHITLQNQEKSECYIELRILGKILVKGVQGETHGAELQLKSTEPTQVSTVRAGTKFLT